MSNNANDTNWFALQEDRNDSEEARYFKHFIKTFCELYKAAVNNTKSEAKETLNSVLQLNEIFEMSAVVVRNVKRESRVWSQTRSTVQFILAYYPDDTPLILSTSAADETLKTEAGSVQHGKFNPSITKCPATSLEEIKTALKLLKKQENSHYPANSFFQYTKFPMNFI